MRHLMQKTLYQTAEAVVSLFNIGCRRLSIRKRMQESLYQTAVQETLYQTADAGDSCICCPIESLLHQMSERETSASAV